ncbi:MAG: AEC family transporter [Ruminococcaceae bacterium]|nr:AEC family transporter [Oscillospiraceae bacterium]
MDIFYSTLNQTTFLFALIAIGYILAKWKYIPENSSMVLSKLENNVFVPALVMGTFMENFTVETLFTARWLLLSSCIIMFVVLPFAILIPKLVTKDKYIQNIYTYGLSFSNFGFMGNAVVSVLFPEFFMDYLIFTLPLWVLIYLWGVPELLIANAGEQKTLSSRFKAFVNPMFVAMIIGMIVGILNISLPKWLSSVVTTSGSCMSPIAMLLTGITVSTISFKKTFTDIRTYTISIVRLIVFPLAFLAVAKLVPMSETVYLCALCSLAMPLGLNTIVIPSAYGKDTSVAAGMAVISHLLSCITIPLIFMIK